VLRIKVADFARQMRTMRVDNARSEAQRLRHLARFGAMFAGNLWDHYGGIFGGLNALDPDAPPRVKRPLRCGDPEVHAVQTDDGVELQLLRFRGGDRGPVVLVHGMGACSGLFTTDTIDTNLTEYLWEQGFDVWLLDWRGSILIPASSGTFDADECAKYDYPAASARIRELTGADGLHWIVHCVGSITFFMSLLGGLEDVKSVVALQVAAHPVPPRMTKIKCALHVPALLQKLGMKSLSAQTYGEGVADRAFNEALRLTPLPDGERCSSAVCLRCTFLYSLCWVHANLTRATHDAIHEMMGVANLEMMEHLAKCASHEKLVDVKGHDAYLPHLDRLSMPITLIQGAENQVWTLEATETTYDALVARFGPGNYRRHVIPGYGHLDTVFGRDAVHDTYPHMLEHLVRAGA
jgi:cholesterol oxidase